MKCSVRKWLLSLWLPGSLAPWLPGCGAHGEPAQRAVPAVSAELPPPADSLILTAGNGTTVWFAEGRKSTHSDGSTCYERTLEIRRDTVRLKVPLLYTLAVPELEGDTAMVADLYSNCRAAAKYRVTLKDGRPVRVME